MFGGKTVKASRNYVTKNIKGTGVVKRLVDYGAFIDIGGVDGLAHISDLSWDHKRLKRKNGIRMVSESRLNVIQIPAKPAEFF